MTKFEAGNTYISLNGAEKFFIFDVLYENSLYSVVKVLREDKIILIKVYNKNFEEIDEWTYKNTLPIAF